MEISIKSASELDYHLQLARDYRILGSDYWRALSAELFEIRKMLWALRRRVLSD